MLKAQFYFKKGSAFDMALLNRINRLTTLVFFIFTTSLFAQGVSPTFTYQGRVMNAAGTAPLTGTLTFISEIYNPAGNCLLYAEHQDVTTADGLFSIQIGSSTGSTKRNVGYGAYPNDPGLTLQNVFKNLGVVRTAGANCAAGYTANSNDNRILKLYVFDGSATTTLADQTLTPVPQAINAGSLDGIGSVGFVQTWVNTASRPANPQTNLIGYNIDTKQFERWTGATWALLTPVFGDNTIDGTASTNDVMRWNGTQWVAASIGSVLGSASGDLSGTWPNITVTRIQGSPVSATAPTTTGQVLKWNGTAWAPATDAGGINTTGTVTDNFIPKFTTTGTQLTNSSISDDGTEVTINNPLDMSGNIISGITTSGGPTEAVSVGYLTAYVQNGNVTDLFLRWDIGTAAWVPHELEMADISDLNLSGYLLRDGTTALTGNWGVGGFDITNIGYMTQANNKYFGLSKLTNAQQATLETTLDSSPAAYKGTIWFNADTNQIMYYDGTDPVAVGSGSGGEINTASNLGVAAGTNEGIFASKTGVDLQFKRLQEGTGITLSSDADYITIASSSSPVPAGTTTSAILRWDGTAWVEETDVLVDASGNVTINGTLRFDAGQTVDAISTSTTLDGVSAANTRLPTQLAVKTYVDAAIIAGDDVDAGSASGQMLRWNGTRWVPITLTSGQFLVGNGAAPSVATAVSMSGDATLSNAGVLTVTGLRGSALPTFDTNGELFYWDNTNTQWRKITAPSGNGQVLTWNTALNTGAGGWEPAAVSAGVTISGTDNRIAMFNAAGNNVENSNIEDNGTDINILTGRNLNVADSQIKFGGSRFINSYGSGSSFSIGGNNAESGNNNVMLGQFAGNDFGGGSQFNVGVGVNTLGGISNGVGNVAVGHQAGFRSDVNSSNNIFIGFNAGPSSNGTFSNRLYIHNNLSDTPLIYGDFANNFMRIHNILELPEIAAPATPDSGYGRVFTKTDGKLYFLNDSGTEFDLTSTGSGGITSLNGLTDGTQTFAITTPNDGSVTTPSFNSATGTHTLRIPMASGTGVTAGLISKSDLDRIPASGTTTSAILRWDGTAWVEETDVLVDASGNVTINGTLRFDAGQTVDAISTSTTLDGVSAANTNLATQLAVKTYVDAAITAGDDVDAGSASGQMLRWNGTRWVPITLTSGQIIVGDGSSVATPVAVSGDATLSNAGAVTVTGLRGSALPTFDTNGELFYWDNTNTQWRKITAPSGNGQVLTWNTALNTGAGGWEPAAPGSGADNLGNHTATEALKMAGNTIFGNSTASGDLTLESTSNATKGDVIIQPNGGNVGVGTSTPDSLLHADRGSSTGVSFEASAGIYSSLKVHHNSDGVMLAATAGAGVEPDLRFYTYNSLGDVVSGSTKMIIKNSGNVGIGTVDPNALLTVEGAMSLREMAAPTQTADYGKVYAKTDGKLYFLNDSGTEFDLTSTGSSGITSLNGLTDGTQTFAITTPNDGSVTTPSFNSATGTHTLRIPMASGTGVTAGLISKSDLDRIPASGTTTSAILRWDGTAWVEETDVLVDASGNVTINGTLRFDAGQTVDAISTSTTLDGVSAANTNLATQLAVKTYVDAAITAGDDVDAGSASGQMLRWNGTRWVPITLTSGQIIVGDGSSVATPVAVSGDATLANTGALTIANSAVTYTKMQNVSATNRLLGRATAGAGVIEEITLGSGLSFTGTTLNVTGGGDVRAGATNTVYIGTTAGPAAHTSGANNNTAAGATALDSLNNANADDNTAYGYAALTALTSGARNVAIGSSAMPVTTTSNDNIAIGNLALNANVSSYHNIAIGSSSMVNLNHSAGDDDVNNISIGVGSMRGVTNGMFNVAIGTEALGGQYSTYQTSGSTAVGYQALTNSNPTLYLGNDAFGRASLFAATSGYQNSAFGNSSGVAITTGYHNNAFGDLSLGRITTGSANTAIGYNSGYTANTTSTGNVFIGTSAGPASTSVVNNSLYIHNAASNTPLIGGSFAYSQVKVNGRFAAAATTNANALTGTINANFTASNTIRSTATAGACGTLNFQNTTAGGSYTITLLNATATCTTIQWNGAATNVKLPSGYTGGEVVSGVVYTAIDDGATLWVSYVGF